MKSTKASKGQVRRTAGMAAMAAMLISGLMGLPAVANAASQTDLYAAPGGTGSACTQNEPCSVASAQQAVRSKTGSMSGDIVVNLAGGRYAMPAPLVLTEQDSGRNGFTVRWQAASGAAPVFSGGQQVSGWTPAGKPGLWKANIGAQPGFRQLYVNDERAVRARTPFKPQGFTLSSTGYNTTAAAALAGYKNVDQIEFSYRILWSYSRCPVASASGNTVTMAQPCFSNARSSPYLLNNQPEWLENAYEFLDQPGEWYFDASGAVGDGPNTLYYQPKPGESLTGPGAVGVVVPRTETLLKVEGNGAANRVQNLEVSGVTFAETAWQQPNTSEGFAEEQANLRLVGPNATHWIYDGQIKPPAAVNISYASNILFSGNRVLRTGSAGLTVDRASNNIKVIGNEVSDVSANGIQIGDVTPEDQRPQNFEDRMNTILVSNNYVHDVAREFKGGVGIFAGFIDGLTLENNEVGNVPYTGISVGWGWGYLDAGGRGNGSKAGGEPSNIVRVTTPTIARNTKIIGNYVHDFMAAGADGGAVYTLGAQPDSQERDNFYDGGSDKSPSAGIYFDNGTSGYVATNNVVANVERWLLVNEGANSLANPAAKNNSIYGNFSNVSNKTCCSSLNNYGPNVTVPQGTPWPAAAQTVIATAGLQVAGPDGRGGVTNWRAKLKPMASVDLARTASVSASNVYSAAYDGAKATDGNAISRWATTDSTTSASLTLGFTAPASVGKVVLREAQQHGARIQAYRIQAYLNGQWTTVANGVFPNVQQTLSFPAVSTTQLRLQIDSSAPGPTVSGFEVYGG